MTLSFFYCIINTELSQGKRDLQGFICCSESFRDVLHELLMLDMKDFV